MPSQTSWTICGRNLLAGDIAILHHRVDNLDRRIARIERRLELVEPP
jgi:hypothetical protein